MEKNDLLRFLFRKINRIIPKKKNQIIFESTPDFADNVLSIFDYIKKNEKFNEDYSMVWLIHNQKFRKKLKKKNINAYQKFSIKGLYHLTRSKYIFVTHNSFITLKTRNQILINLWHGMPLKTMLFANPSEFDQNLSNLKKSTDNIDIFIATSAIMKSAISSCFYADPRKIHTTGQPRNDRLFDKSCHQKLSDILSLDISQYKKIVIFCPTFRKSKYMIDGIPQKFNIFNFDDFDEKVFNDFLTANNVLFLLKFHPFEEKYYLSKFGNGNSPNVILLTKKMLQDNFFDLYDILGAIDILITDYSSVYFDFLLINRPIIFTPTDLDEYSQTRGFVLEPYDFWTPGPKVTDFKNFMKNLKIFINNSDYLEDERKLINDIVNKYQDEKSCKRVYELVFKDRKFQF